MSLDTEDGPEQEQNEMKELQKNLYATTTKNLTSQLNELRDKVRELRREGESNKIYSRATKNIIILSIIERSSHLGG